MQRPHGARTSTRPVEKLPNQSDVAIEVKVRRKGLSTEHHTRRVGPRGASKSALLPADQEDWRETTDATVLRRAGAGAETSSTLADDSAIAACALPNSRKMTARKRLTTKQPPTITPATK